MVLLSARLQSRNKVNFFQYLNSMNIKLDKIHVPWIILPAYIIWLLCNCIDHDIFDIDVYSSAPIFCIIITKRYVSTIRSKDNKNQ